MFRFFLDTCPSLLQNHLIVLCVDSGAQNPKQPSLHVEKRKFEQVYTQIYNRKRERKEGELSGKRKRLGPNSTSLLLRSYNLLFGFLVVALRRHLKRWTVVKFRKKQFFFQFPGTVFDVTSRMTYICLDFQWRYN